MADLPDWAIAQIVQRAGRGITEDDRERIVRGVVDAASSAFDQIARRGTEAASEYDLPHVVMRPTLCIDGNQWCALYGENLQDGVAGFGDSPGLACVDFDRAWTTKLTKKEPSRG